LVSWYLYYVKGTEMTSVNSTAGQQQDTTVIINETGRCDSVLPGPDHSMSLPNHATKKGKNVVKKSVNIQGSRIQRKNPNVVSTTSDIEYVTASEAMTTAQFTDTGEFV
jgi:hypothetical protein